MLEETRFKQLLERGLGLLAEETDRPRRPPGAAGRGGIPAVRHLRLPARPDPGRHARAGPQRSIWPGSRRRWREQRTRARAAWAGSGEAATETVWFEIKERTGGTEFLGYSTESAEGEILALVADGQPAMAACRPDRKWRWC